MLEVSVALTSRSLCTSTYTVVLFFLSLFTTSFVLDTDSQHRKSHANGVNINVDTIGAKCTMLNIQSRHGVAEIIDLALLDAQRLEGGAEGFEIDIVTWRDREVGHGLAEVIHGGLNIHGIVVNEHSRNGVAEIIDLLFFVVFDAQRSDGGTESFEAAEELQTY